MREEFVRIGIAGCLLGVLIPLVLAIVHGFDMAKPLLVYTIPIFIGGVALLLVGKRANAESAAATLKPDYQ